MTVRNDPQIKQIAQIGKAKAAFKLVQELDMQAGSETTRYLCLGSDGPGYGEYEHLLCTCTLECTGARGHGGACRKNIIYEQNGRACDKAWVFDFKSGLDAFATRLRVHPGAMPLSMDSANETPFIKRQPC